MSKGQTAKTSDWVKQSSLPPAPGKGSRGQPGYCPAICSKPKILASLNDILVEMAKQKAYSITLPMITARLEALHGATVKKDALRRHLTNHTPELWQKARGLDGQ